MNVTGYLREITRNVRKNKRRAVEQNAVSYEIQTIWGTIYQTRCMVSWKRRPFNDGLYKLSNRTSFKQLFSFTKLA
jgi:hypothetical protein